MFGGGQRTDGRFFRPIPVMIPGGVGPLLLIIAVVDIIWFIVLPEHRVVLIFITSVAAALGIFFAALNATFTRRTQTEQAERTFRFQQEQGEALAQQGKALHAFDLIKRWNDPAFNETRRTAMTFVLDRNKTSPDKIAELENDLQLRTTVLSIYNFFEEMEIAINRGVADNEICFEFFRGIVLKVSSESHSILDAIRDKSGPRAFEHLRTLAQRWDSGKVK